MKIRPYNEEESGKKVLTLRLIQKDDASVSLVAVDENGNVKEAGYLLWITKNGISRNWSVNENLGLALDKAHNSVKLI